MQLVHFKYKDKIYYEFYLKYYLEWHDCKNSNFTLKEA